MKQQLTGLVLGAALVLSLGAYAQKAQQNGTLEERVLKLEQDLVATQEAYLGLAQAAAAEAAAVDNIHIYLNTQAQSAAAMHKTLEKSEQQGFVAGINYPSRETLLTGWRDHLASLQRGVPGAKPQPVETTGRDGRR